MRKIELEQGSQEWLDWRRSLLTATDAPMLMGVSPYVTPFQGWQRKLGLIPEQESNVAMQRGTRDEPIARAMFIERYGINMEPCVVQSDNNDFIGASLDGISECGQYILEVKSNGYQYHNTLDTKGIPEFHFMQMQHQLLSTDNTAKKCYYVSYNSGDIIVKEVYPDKDWQEGYLTKANKFWKGVVLFDPPALTCKDYKDMSDNEKWLAYAHRYRLVNDQIKKLEEEKELFKKEMITISGEVSAKGAGLKLALKNVRGRVDYDQIPELNGVDIEKYRKGGSSFWTVMLDKGRDDNQSNSVSA